MLSLGQKTFGLYTIGQMVTITCTNPDGNLTEWLENTETVVSNNFTSAALTISSLTDVYHDREYTCRAYTSTGTEETDITIIVVGKLH